VGIAIFFLWFEATNVDLIVKIYKRYFLFSNIKSLYFAVGIIFLTTTCSRSNFPSTNTADTFKPTNRLPGYSNLND
ncbi:MAG: hypothetical protein H7258_14990, partial [Ferruginibacter sp.]|nr:hypothetical protein [Ferruginibacter sp.]